MALDNAQFIAELQVDDPPGTDPLNQGDDHIRTTKRATQQSFPNVDAAVPQTAAQMAQMAIKNEVNTFTQQNTFQQLATFNNDITLDSGGTTVINFDEGGLRRWQILYGTTAATFELRRFVGGVLIDAPLQFNNDFGESTFLADASFGRTLLAADGVAGAPAFRFTAETNMGMYRIGATALGFAITATPRFEIRATDIRSKQVHLFIDGTEANPGITFLNQTDSGMFRGSSTQLNFATGGVHGMTLSTIQIQSVHDGVEAFPGYGFASDPGTGMWASATSCNLSANGQTIASFTSSSDIFAAVGRSWSANSLQGVGRPGFNFNSDSDTGFYNPNPNTIGITTGGVAWGTMDASALWMANGRSVHGDGESLVGNPAFSFTNDTDTGFSRKQANVASIIASGVEIVTVGTGGFGVRSGTPTFLNLPTSPGVNTSLWNDNGTVKVA